MECRVSIHHMLLFILNISFSFGNLIKFQYITCYSLSSTVSSLLIYQFVSIHHMLLFIVDGSVSSWYYCRFNTSHVTLYLIFDSQKIVLAEFQYITCYSLSESLMISSVSADVSIHHMLLFIFRLTENVSLVKFVSIHHILLFIGATSAAAVTIHAGFNTSHVTLYLRAEIEKIKVPFGFNTSHVTLYQLYQKD